MRLKKAVILCAVILLIILFVWAGSSAISYAKIASACDAIRSGSTEDAIHKIQRIGDVDQYSAPLWLRGIYHLAEEDIDLLLVVACREGEAEIVEMLLEKGADPNRYLESGWSPIEATFVDGNETRYEIAQMLIEHGADVNLHGSNTSALFHELHRLIYSQDLTQSAYAAAEASVLLLIDNGAALTDEKGNTALHFSAFSDQMALTERLLACDAAMLNAANQQGETALIWAVKAEATQTARYLLERGADQMLQDEEGKTAFDYAEESGNAELVELFQTPLPD